MSFVGDFFMQDFMTHATPKMQQQYYDNVGGRKEANTGHTDIVATEFGAFLNHFKV